MPQTYYVLIAGETRGPYLNDQLWSMWNHGVLTADTLYWNEPKQEWHALTAVLYPQATVASVPPPTAAVRAEEVTLAPANYRFMARFLDLLLFGYFGSFLAELVVMKLAIDVPTWYFPLTFAVAVAAETLWLMAFKRTTPGKWLFGMSIHGLSNNFLTRRTLSVYWRCALIFAPFTTPLAFRDIRQTGTTAWDKKTNSRVYAAETGTARTVFARLIFAVAFVGYFIRLLMLFFPSSQYGQ